MQRLITEIWVALAIAAALGGVAVWAAMRIWVAHVLARRDQVTMARLKAADESWTERVWRAEEERDKAQARVEVMDTRLASALEAADAMELQLRGLGAPLAPPRASTGPPALTVRIRDAGSDDPGTELPVEMGTTAPERVDPPPRPEAAPLASLPYDEPAAPPPGPHRRGPLNGRAADGSGQTDDLTRIEGVGFGYAARLNALGYWRFSQIADWSSSDIERVAGALGTTPGRIEEADWIRQARALRDGAGPGG